MANPSLLIIPDRYKAAKLYSQLPESGDGDFVVTRGTTATRVNASGLIESVASGVPRLDYTGGGCPSLLVEPAATNLLLRSEEFDNASWIKTNLNTTGTPPWVNVAVAPNGTTTAEKIIADTTNGVHRVQQGGSLLSGNAYTFSVYAKKSEYDFVEVLQGASGGAGLSARASRVNLTNGTIVSETVAGQTKVIDANNGWYRISITTSVTTGGGAPAFVVGALNNSAGTDFAGNDSDGIFIWGAQLETGSVATSYIPTAASTVTRNADVISLSSVSGLIGQTEGTIYVDFAYFGTPSNRTGPLYLRQGFLRGISINYSAPTPGIEVISRNDAGLTSVTAVSGALQIGTYYKMAIAYDAAGTAAGGTRVNGLTVYVNGVLAGTGDFRVPDAASLNEIRLYGANSGVDTETMNGRIKAAAIYTSRLSDSELIALTTL